MTCQEFLSHQPDYVDGCLDAAVVARCDAHLSGCANCARRERILRKSLSLLSELPAVAPSTDFQTRLDHRLLHLQDELARHDRFAGSGTLAVLAIAATIALVAWGPMLFQVRPEGMPAVAVQSVRTPASLEYYGRGSGAGDGGASLSATFPGPYSPLIVEAPVTRASPGAARAMFAAYYPLVE